MLNALLTSAQDDYVAFVAVNTFQSVPCHIAQQ